MSAMRSSGPNLVGALIEAAGFIASVGLVAFLVGIIVRAWLWH